MPAALASGARCRLIGGRGQRVKTAVRSAAWQWVGRRETCLNVEKWG